MSTETTNKRKRRKSSKAKRRIRLALIIVIGVLFITLLAMVGLYLYKQWERRFESTTSVVFILKDDKIVSNDVIGFDTNKYSETELSSFIDETINTYNKEHGEDSVVLESLKVENQIASLILSYENAEVYQDFSGNELFVGTIAEAVSQGYSFEGRFASLVDKTAVECSVEKFYDQPELKVAIIKANTKVSVEGEIRYLSSENVAEYGNNWVVTKDGCNLLPAGNTGIPATETETESTSETENVDGSVDETDLVTEEEETGTEIIFDFGDEDTSEEVGDTYSEVYTYIIYK